MKPNGPLAFFQTWSKKTWIIVGSAAVIILIVVIVVPVEVAKENAYPSYTSINYTLADTYSGESFFDEFDYFTDTGECKLLLDGYSIDRVPLTAWLKIQQMAM